jgi:hypothetical protein
MGCEINCQGNDNHSNLEVKFSGLTLSEVLALKNALEDYSTASRTGTCLMFELNNAMTASKIF